MNYTKEQTQNIHQQQFQFLIIEEENHVLTISLNRPEKKNALHPIMVNELAYAMHYAKFENNVRLVVLKAKGNVFCAGADLKSFMGSTVEITSTIPEPSGMVLIGDLFNEVYTPTIAVVEGNVFAGGHLIVASCNYVIAHPNVNFALPEVKRGLFPFQVMDALLKIMPPKQVLDWCIRGYSINCEKAYQMGLVTHISENTNKDLESLTVNILSNSPNAIRLGLEAYHTIQGKKSKHEYLMKMLVKAIQSEDAKEGILAFKEKRQPNWK